MRTIGHFRFRRQFDLSPAPSLPAAQRRQWLQELDEKRGVRLVFRQPNLAVKDETGLVTTTPALYLWNQPQAENNHTPAWDTFSIPLP